MSFHLRDNIVERALIPLLKPLSGSSQPRQLDSFGSPTRISKEHEPITLIDGYQACTRVVVHERLSLVALSVTWSDPTLGHFTGQVWRKGTAHTDAFCALTGMPIQQGDAVFRPRSYDFHVPANAGRMILESALNLPPSEV
jgi:hypothetical protein